MDFKSQEMSFGEADRRYAELERQRAAGTIGEEEFESQRQQLMLLDGEGRWWAKSRDSGEWRYHDGNTWIPGVPPPYREDGSGAAEQSARTPPTPAASGRRRRRSSLWIAGLGLGGLALIAAVVVGWVLVPSVGSSVRDFIGSVGQSGGSQNGQSQQGKSGQGSSQQDGGSAPEGAVFNAMFVHDATAENISGNSTYIDNPVTNSDPNAILQVTQNWNPGESEGIYNNHEIGVWYDTDADKWAIFNQDRAEMVEGASFNVGVVKEAK